MADHSDIYFYILEFKQISVYMYIPSLTTASESQHFGSVFRVLDS